MGSATSTTLLSLQAISQLTKALPRKAGPADEAAPNQVSPPPIQGKVPRRRRRVDDGKLHFVQGLGRHPETGVFLFRFSYRGRIHAGSTRCYRLNEARDYVNALKGKLSLEGVGIKHPKIVTFGQCFDTWMRERAPQRTQKYVGSFRCMVVKHVLPLIGGLTLPQVDLTAVSTVLNKYLETHTRAGANTLALHISALLAFAVEKGWLKDKPKISKVPVQKLARPIITEETLDQFLATLDGYGNPHVSFLVRAQLLMGMRKHEALHMKWSGLRLDQKVFIPDKTKNGDAPVMPIPEAMLPWFEKLAQAGGTFGYICPARDGQPRAHDFTTRYIRRAVKELGLSDKLTDHRLRASFANILNKKGVPLPTIQKLMRHTRIETTMIYIETREDEMRTAINLVG